MASSQTYFEKNKQLYYSELQKASNEIGVPSDWLDTVIELESKRNPTLKNFIGSKAVGLIQFMPATAKELGTSTYALSKMGYTEQFRYVVKYLLRKKKETGLTNIASLEQLYLLVLYPKAAKKDYSYVIFKKGTKAYTQNKGLDFDKKGDITKLDVTNYIHRRYSNIYGDRGFCMPPELPIECAPESPISKDKVEFRAIPEQEANLSFIEKISANVQLNPSIYISGAILLTGLLFYLHSKKWKIF